MSSITHIRHEHLPCDNTAHMYSEDATHQVTTEITGAQYATLLGLGLWGRISAGSAAVTGWLDGEITVYDHYYERGVVREHHIMASGHYEAFEIDVVAGSFRPILSEEV